MKFILTIDTEADNQWNHGCDLTVKNIKSIPRLQDLCNQYEVKPTYLITSEVSDDGYARELFKEYLNLNLAEIGAHLHSWTTPPFLDKEGFRFNDVNHAFLSEFPNELISAKVKNLTEQIEYSIGIRPVSFRSGRYGFNDEVAKALIDNFYLVDSSVTPFTSWSLRRGLPGGIGGPDFINKTPTPFKYQFNNGSLLEIPTTILPTRYPLNINMKFARYYFQNVDHNILLKALRKFWFHRQPLALRPFEWMNQKLFEKIIGEAKMMKLPYIVMLFHSSELMAGGSIYWRDGKAVDRLFGLLEEFYILLKKMGIESVTLKEAASSFEK